MLCRHNPSVMDEQDVMLYALGNITGARGVSLTCVELCDFMPEYAQDPPRTAACHLFKSKADKRRKGHIAQIGRARCARFDVVQYWLCRRPQG